MARLLRSQQLRDIIFCLALALAAGFLLLYPKEATASAADGLRLCANVIVPSLFPFFVLSSMMVNLGLVRYLGRILEPVMRPVFGLSGACSAALALGMIGGYPVGARTALGLYESGEISRREAERLLAFCNNCGPAFIFGVVGAGVFSSGMVGLLLYLIHMLASLLIGAGFRLFAGPVPQEPRRKTHAAVTAQRFPAAFTGAVKDSCFATLQICAFITCFTVLIRFAFLTGVPAALAAFAARVFGTGADAIEALLIGAIELSSGVWALKGASAVLSSKAAMAAFLLGWAGLCVHCQVLSFTGQARLSMRPYLAGKLLHSLLSAALVWVVFRLVPLPQSAANCYAGQVQALCAQRFSSAIRASTITASIVWGTVAAICLRYFHKSSGNRRNSPV